MAGNIMNMKEVRNRPSRDSFDLSTKRNFTAKVGELLPIWFKPLIPGDAVDINLQSFTRTQPLNTAAFARVREYYDFYFVPIDQMYIYAPTVLTQMYNNPQRSRSKLQEGNTALSSRLPYITTQSLYEMLRFWDASADDVMNEFGFSRPEMSAKLLSYLGYGTYSSLLTAKSSGWQPNEERPSYSKPLSIFPLLAYQKIYNDFYRFQQWETAQPWTFNVDWMNNSTTSDKMLYPLPTTNGDDFYKSTTLFDLRYCNYHKDLIHGLLPNTQYGDAATVSLSIDGSGVIDGGLMYVSAADGTGLTSSGHSTLNVNPLHILDTVSGDGKARVGAGNASSVTTDLNIGVNGNVSFSSSEFSILALRQAEFLQKWKEVAQAADEDYQSQIQAHWGVNVSEYMSDKARYLGGTTASLDINEVVNNNITGDNGADIAGKGVISGNGHIHFESRDQYGYIMCIYHAVPILDYIVSGTNPDCMLVESTDWPIPEFDKIGMESVYHSQISNPQITMSTTATATDYPIGYAPRYINWKTDIDRSLGGFSVDDEALSTWVLKANDSTIFPAFSNVMPVPNPNDENPNRPMNYANFKVNPRVMDSLFAVQANAYPSTDTFLCSSFFDVRMARNLDRNGLPY